MADDTYSRGYRGDRHDRGGAEAPGPAPDPLTELARLIGQSDPFATDRNRQPEPNHGEAQPADWRTDPAQHSPHYDTGTHGDQYGADQNGYADPQQPHHDAGHGDAAGYGEAQPYHQDQQAYPQDQQAYHHDPQAYHPDQHPYYQDQPQTEPQHFAHASAAAEAGGDGDHESPEAHGAYGAAPPFFGDPNARPDDYYEDAPAPRRGWVVTVAALAGLAVIGTAGAFAYRAVFTGGETRIITRDVGPSKITPAQTSQDVAANKGGDRLASANRNERLGPPPEQPITIPDPPRTVPPALSQSQPAAPAAPALSAPSSPAASLDTGGPPARVVRTERIKPIEQLGDTAATRPAPPARAGGPSSLQPPQPRVVSPAAPAAPAPNTPLSLAPQGIPNTAAPAMAPAPAPAPPAHTTAVASNAHAERSNGGGGGSGYFVQLSAQKSEDEAKSSFRGIQARHGSLLGGQQPVIRRKDLGSKGVFYGAQVGPFSREAAAKLCEDLKSAGQSCMVQKN